MSDLATLTLKNQFVVDVYDWGTQWPTKKPGKITRTSFKKGIINLTISSDKSSSSASIVVAGPVPNSLALGNWIRIRANSDDKINVTPKREPNDGMTVFIGQIASITTTHMRTSGGALIQRTRIDFTGWQKAVNTPVKIDTYSYLRLFKPDSQLQAVNVASALSSKASNVLDARTQVEKMTGLQMTGFSVPDYVLMFIGILDANSEATDSLKEHQGFAKNYADVCTHAPKIPPALLVDMGVSADGFFLPSSGSIPFLSVFSGIVKRPEKEPPSATPDPKARVSAYRYEDMRNFFTLEHVRRPYKLGLQQSLAMGGAALDVIRSFAESHFFDIYTCLMPVYAKENDEWQTAIPALVCRDWPWMPKVFADKLSSCKCGWTVYDDVPRAWIDDAYIDQVTITATSQRSPNSIRFQFSDGIIRGGTQAALTQFGTWRTSFNAMDRFGAQEAFISTQYPACSLLDAGSVKRGTQAVVENPESMDEWRYESSLVMYAWHAFDYRTVSGSLQMKMTLAPIAIGGCISFPYGKSILCGQVESINYNLVVLESGLVHHTMSVSFIRGMRVDRSDGSLHYFDTNDILSEFSETNPYVDSIPSTASTGGDDLEEVLSAAANSSIEATQQTPRDKKQKKILEQ